MSSSDEKSRVAPSQVKSPIIDRQLVLYSSTFWQLKCMQFFGTQQTYNYDWGKRETEQASQSGSAYLVWSCNQHTDKMFQI